MLSRTAVIVLAAGLSRRFGEADKLMATLEDRPLAAHVLDTVRGLRPAQAILVTRPDSELAVMAHGFDIVINPQPQDGMAGSIALGIAAVQPQIEAAFIALADMPFVRPQAYERLVQSRADIALPDHGGRPGHPVLFRRVCFEELMRLSGDTGARSLITSGGYSVERVAMGGTGGLIDIDTPDDLQRNGQ